MSETAQPSTTKTFPEEERRELLDRIAELESRVFRQDEAFAIAAHELRNALAILQPLVELTMRERDTLPARISVMLQRVSQQAQRMGGLVQNLLGLARLQCGEFSRELSRVDLAELLEDLASRHAFSIQRASCTLRLQVTGVVVGNWDRCQLEQVLTNLLANAYRHAPGSVITVRAWRGGGFAHIEVSDTGPGIAANQLKRVFDRYQSGERAGGRKGLGLGLYISRQIVEAHQGALSVRSESGKGAAFEIVLPLVDDEAEESSQDNLTNTVSNDIQ